MKGFLGMLLIAVLADAVPFGYHLTVGVADVGRITERNGRDTEGGILSSPELEWSKTYGGPYNDWAYSLVQTSDGGYALAGMSWGGPWLVKTDSSGNMQWNRFLEVHVWTGLLSSLVQTADEGYAVVCEGEGGLDELDKLDSAGNLQWFLSSSWNESLSYHDISSMVQTFDGGYAMSSGSSPVLIKIDPAGSLQWNKTYGAGFHLRSVVQTSDGGFAIAGHNYEDDFLLVKTDPVGNMLWSQTYGRFLYGFPMIDVGESVIQTIDGGYAIIGESMGIPWLVKTDPTGNAQWNQTCEGTGYDVRSLVQTSDGGYAMAGSTYYGELGNSDSLLIRTDSAGNMQWNQTYGEAHSHEEAYALVQLSDSSYAIAGCTNSSGAGYDDFWLIKTFPETFVDSDGDGLYDVWETDGIDYNSDCVVDLTIPGANPQYKDLYIEIDYMSSDGTHDHNPDPNAINDVEAAFRNAPVNNPNGTSGIALHIQVDESFPHQNAINVWDDFNNIKSSRFGTAAQRNHANSANILAAKRLAYRYALFVHQFAYWDNTLSSWVTTTSSGVAEICGNDFLVSLGAFTNSKGTRSQQAATLMHELGHTLNLRHGGGDDINGKPNYLSIMSYSRQFDDYITDRPLDYSRAKLPTLNESNLDEAVGIGGPSDGRTVYGPLAFNVATNRWQGFVDSSQGPIDWDRNGIIGNNIARNINDFRHDFRGPQDDTLGLLEGYNDWANLKYNYRFSSGFKDGAHFRVADQEIDLETVEKMKNTTIIGFHDVATTDVKLFKTVVGIECSVSFNVTITNQGYFNETYDLSLYADLDITTIGDEIAIETISNLNLTAKKSAVMTYVWDTTEETYGSYAISAYVTQVTNETDIADNICIGSRVLVTISGDINGDSAVNIYDLHILGKVYSSTRSTPNWNPNADINNDLVVNTSDLEIQARNYGKTT